MQSPLEDDWEWCEDMLTQVSRTFALCIRFLPDDVRRPVLLSYLLCRVADTVEDAPDVDLATKRRLLDLFGRALADPSVDVGPLKTALPAGGDADTRLAAGAGRVLGLLREQPPAVAAAVVPWVQEMCHGMAEFAGRPVRELGDGGTLRGLDNEADLDRYCYYVAGTVGHLLTAVFAAVRPRIDARAAARLDALAEDFGAGLQLVNILADVARDRQRGVSYVPETVCRAEGLAVADLLEPSQRPRARAALAWLSRRARERLQHAREYCLAMPRTEYQLRLFCLVPYYLALRTLRALEEDRRYPEAGLRVKVGRSVVYRTVTAARVCAASNHLLRAYAWRLEFVA
ncbi:MAG TPA: phytoene/squalene synthase family protein [Candidatus Krumholzibacteria bacterium]|nr:phytoene/squalene synthase family protein [Candidatus Krumholzibacteria bacterium]HPD71003.1 phytoene/squalene synthase family protein [Candidatus Krumholzibacteria bacterium]HRY39297.1 phytoene/squalene synthase family protein [Candidatus Krumholzibacteria bacterium]